MSADELAGLDVAGLDVAGIDVAGIDVVVLAGGLGTRLQGVLNDTPKVLAPVAGAPFLDHLLAWFARLGVRRVVLCLGHLAERVTGHLAARPADRTPGLEIVPVIEPAPLGTAGALRLARPHLGSDPVLILNGDSVVAADLGAFLAGHRAAGTIGSLLAVPVADAGRYGRLELDQDSRITRFAEKDPDHPGPGLINAGFYLFSAALLDAIAASPGPSLERDILARLPAGTLHAEVAGPGFIDIGTPESLAQAATLVPHLLGRGA
jgi:mannose-1-phosphate guanylyltransferase